MESVIIEYQQRQNEIISSVSSDVEVCLAADETFFEGVILGMLDLPSGYIFVEEAMQRGLGGFPHERLHQDNNRELSV